MINVTKTFLPPIDEYLVYLNRAWSKGWVTNNGELVIELERKLKEFLGVKHLFFCTNGTIVLQMAIKALGLNMEIITTPFSYVATTSAILWENCTPVFCDINNSDFNIDASQIEWLITENTQAILATHVFGNPCDIEKIEAIASKYKLKVIYDGAHAFGCTYKNKSLLSYGNISTCSFHATKLFHTVEGGCIITDNDEVAHQLMLFRQFGHINDEHFSIGINAKNSEFHAAMGLTVFPYIQDVIKERKLLSEKYFEFLAGSNLIYPKQIATTIYNYSYFPVVFESEEQLLMVKQNLANAEIFARRYFYPSLNTLPYLNSIYACSVSESISKRILCLPLYAGLLTKEVELICSIIKQNLK